MTKAKTKRKKQPAAMQGVGPTPEFLIKVPVQQIETMTAGVKAHRAEVECKLDWYWRRMLLTWKPYQAGLRFREAFDRAGIAANQVSSYGGAIGGRSTLTERQLEARQKLAQAHSWLKGDYALVERVCGHDEWAGGDLATLRTILGTLAQAWGIGDEEGGQDHGR